MANNALARTGPERLARLGWPFFEQAHSRREADTARWEGPLPQIGAGEGP